MSTNTKKTLNSTRHIQSDDAIPPETVANTPLLDRTLKAIDTDNVLEFAICLPSEEELGEAGLSVQQLLFQAVTAGATSIIDILVEKGAYVNMPLEEETKTMGGNIILAKALISKDPINMIKVLLEHGADTSVQDNAGNNVLHWAAWQTEEQIWPLLFNTGVDVNTRNKTGETPLLRASFSENWVAVNLLVKVGANINAQNKKGQTALHMASAGIVADLENVISLIEQDADWSIRDNDGLTALDWATQPSIKEYLSQFLVLVAEEPDN